MTTIYFSSDSTNIIKYIDHPTGGIVGDALLFYEGDHIDNKGRKHSVPAERIQLIATNTNIDFNQGRDIPFKVEHRKTLIDDKGSVNKLGNMSSAVSCRPIEESDLANPRLNHLIGKLGAFAQIHVLDKIDAVKNKTIKAISAGIDPIKNKFIEISAVDNPSLVGASLLFSNYDGTANFAQHGMTSYEEAKEKIEAWQKPHEELMKKFEIFLGVLMAIEHKQDDDSMGFNPLNLKREALEEFTEDMVNYLGITFDDESEQNPEDIYSPNPYDSSPYQQTQPQQQYSEKESDNVLEFNKPFKRAKRQRRTQ